MKALVISETGQTSYIERPQPTPAPGEVLLQVKRLGYCGTDLNTFRGFNPLVTYPRIPGHEIGAVIERYRRVGQGNPDAKRIATYLVFYPLDMDKAPRA